MVGRKVGSNVGLDVTVLGVGGKGTTGVGDIVGSTVGDLVGLEVEADVGDLVGLAMGGTVVGGDLVGTAGVGGALVGDTVGEAVGAGVLQSLHPLRASSSSPHSSLSQQALFELYHSKNTSHLSPGLRPGEAESHKLHFFSFLNMQSTYSPYAASQSVPDGVGRRDGAVVRGTRVGGSGVVGAFDGGRGDGNILGLSLGTLIGLSLGESLGLSLGEKLGDDVSVPEMGAGMLGVGVGAGGV
jgi:hypothetical protein